jgi:ankyrin repeat protein
MKWLKRLFGNPELDNALLEAAEKGDLPEVKRLLAGGADKDARRKFDGWTPLHLAAWKNHVDVVRCLLEAGADKNAKNDQGDTPIHWAVDLGHVDAVRCLLEAGADPSAKGWGGRTPWVIARTNFDQNMIRLLKSYL